MSHNNTQYDQRGSNPEISKNTTIHDMAVIVDLSASKDSLLVPDYVNQHNQSLQSNGGDIYDSRMQDSKRLESYSMAQISKLHTNRVELIPQLK
jgi:hypothetical protein